MASQTDPHSPRSSVGSSRGSSSPRSPHAHSVAAPSRRFPASPPLSHNWRLPHLLPSPTSSSSHSHHHSMSRRLLGPMLRSNHRTFSSPSSTSSGHQSSLQNSSSGVSNSTASRPSQSGQSTAISRRLVGGRSRSRSRDMEAMSMSLPSSPGGVSSGRMGNGTPVPSTMSLRSKGKSETLRTKECSDCSVAATKAKARNALKENDAMVYLDGPQVYTCAQCRTHLTSHDDIISKSFHGRHGRAYLFDQCVNVTIGPAEDRVLITGLHSVCDIFCKRCKGMVGWTYAKAYESSQKYKEGKFIIEKINLHLEESDYFNVSHPAGERSDKWRIRSMSWGSEHSAASVPASPRVGGRCDIVYEYRPAQSATSPHQRARSASVGGSSSGSSFARPRFERSGTGSSLPPPPFL